MLPTILKLFVVLRLLQAPLCVNTSVLQSTVNGTAVVGSSSPDDPPSTDLVLPRDESSPSLNGTAGPTHNGSEAEGGPNSSPPGEAGGQEAAGIPEHLRGKHPSLLACTLQSFEPGEYKVLPDGTLEVHNVTYNSSLFFVANGTASVCQASRPWYDSVMAPVTLAGLVVSMLGLVVRLGTFFLAPYDLANLFGLYIAAHTASLFVSLATNMSAESVQGHPRLCVAIALLTQVFLLSAVLWMSAVSLDMYLHASGKTRVASLRFRLKRFGLYGVYALGFALVLSSPTLVAEVAEGLVPDEYRPGFSERCWFSRETPQRIFFGVPVLVLLAHDFVLFFLSAFALRQSKAKPVPEGQESFIGSTYSPYFSLSVIMGVTWVTGLMAACGQTSLLFLLFVALCMSHVLSMLVVAIYHKRGWQELHPPPSNPLEKDKITDCKPKDSNGAIGKH